jgi:hypothetical protein
MKISTSPYTHHAMRQILLLTSFLALFTTSWLNAQSPDGRGTTFAVLAGVNLQNHNGKNTFGDKLENQLITGYHLGAHAQIPIAPSFFFQPGLLFSVKGAKATEGNNSITYKLNYVELPLNLVYKAALGRGYLFLGFGPYLAYGVSGKATYDLAGFGKTTRDVDFKNEIEASDPFLTPYFKAWDAGGNIFVGYELRNGLFLQLNTQLGMLDIHPKDKRIPGDKASIKNTGFGLSLGYRI